VFIVARPETGPQCAACAATKHRCVECGRVVKTRPGLLDGPVCNRCVERLRCNPGPCPGCGDTKILAFLDTSNGGSAPPVLASRPGSRATNAAVRTTSTADAAPPASLPSGSPRCSPAPTDSPTPGSHRSVMPCALSIAPNPPFTGSSTAEARRCCDAWPSARSRSATPGSMLCPAPNPWTTCAISSSR
jgi:hypothetical protein